MEQKKWNRNDRRPPLRRAQELSEAAENMLEGRNAVQEALAAGRPIDKLYIAAGETDRALARLAAMAKEAGAAVVETERPTPTPRSKRSSKTRKAGEKRPSSSCATICRTRITSAPSSARRSARARTASSSRSAAASA